MDGKAVKNIVLNKVLSFRSLLFKGEYKDFKWGRYQVLNSVCFKNWLTIICRSLFGDYRLYINIESDYVTCNSNVVFRRLKTVNFLYLDRHGNWVLGKYNFHFQRVQHLCSGSEVGKPRGWLRSNPKEGGNLECPCEVRIHGLQQPVTFRLIIQISSWQKWEDGWKDDDTIIVTKYKTYSKGY